MRRPWPFTLTETLDCLRCLLQTSCPVDRAVAFLKEARMENQECTWTTRSGYTCSSSYSGSCLSQKFKTRLRSIQDPISHKRGSTFPVLNVQIHFGLCSWLFTTCFSFCVASTSEPVKAPIEKQSWDSTLQIVKTVVWDKCKLRAVYCKFLHS